MHVRCHYTHSFRAASHRTGFRNLKLQDPKVFLLLFLQKKKSLSPLY
jgi:hypothetical protein